MVPHTAHVALHVTQVGNAPLNAIMFAAYGHATRFINDEANGLQSINSVPYGAICVAGAWAGLLQCVVVTPTELVKCKLQVQGATGGAQRMYQGPLDCFRKVCLVGYGTRGRCAWVLQGVTLCMRVRAQMVKTRGVLRGLYTGWWTTIWRDVPSTVRVAHRNPAAVGVLLSLSWQCDSGSHRQPMSLPRRGCNVAPPPAQAVYFGVYEFFKQELTTALQTFATTDTDRASAAWTAMLLAGGLSGVATVR